MRVLMLTQWFNPEPIFKGLTFAKALRNLGHEVEVLTGFPNYPGGKVYDGYRICPWQREELEGIPILRVPLYTSHDRSGLRRMMNYGSFAASAALLGPVIAKPADLLYVYQPITIGLAAIILKYARRMPFLIDIQDLWPDYLPATGMITNEKMLWTIGKWCDLVYSHAAKITVLSPGYKKSICARGVNPDKVEVIYNWCDENQVKIPDYDRLLADELGVAGKFNIVFAGTMGKAQALDAVVEAAKIAESRFPQVQFVFIGEGVEAAHLKRQASGSKNVLFVPRQPLSQIGRYLSLADALLIHLKADPIFESTIPSKTQTSLAAGKPIIMGVRGDAADLIHRAGAGVTCTPEDPESLLNAIERLLRLPETALGEMGRRGKEFYWSELSLAKGVLKFDELFRTIAKCPGRAAG